MADQQFNLGSSEEQILEPVNWLPRQKSSDSIFGELLGPPTYGQRPLIFPYHPHAQDQNLCPKVFKPKEKKVKSKKPCDYRKNICGYITKKIIREYLSATYRDRVQQLCDKHGCDYNASKTYFLGRIERITGPSHIPSLFVPGHQAQKPVKAAFKEFFIWFTKERYLRYLILEGKMQQKEAYIEYKNTVLMHLVNQSSDQPIPSESSSSSLNEESQP